MFKDIPWYEWLYQINEDGEVLRINSWKILKHNFHEFWYPYVALSNKWIINVKKIHRLIAIVFIPNPNNYPCVLHLDNDPLNYSINNLIWWTQKDNIKQCHKEKRHPFNFNHPLKWKFWKYHNCSKKVNQYTKKWNFIAEWASSSDISRELWISSWILSECCNWKRKSAGWFIWKFNI